MRKALFFMVAAMALSSCTEDVSMPNPGFQGLKDDVLWRGSGAVAELVEGGAVSIQGAKKFETLILDIPSTDVGTYILGENEATMATFIVNSGAEQYTYTTGTDSPAAGEIRVTEYDSTNQLLTGSFRFNALIMDDNPVVLPVLNFQQGIFYKIPVR